MQNLPSVAFHTLGCKLNFSETSALARHLEQEGFVQKNFEEEADYYVINTCSVTENADKECRQLVRRIQRRSPSSAVVITGCYAQLKPKEIASIPGVDLVLGAAAKFELATHLQALKKGDDTKICSCDIDTVENFHASWSVHHRTRTFLKVQDGCNYNCSFCTIPMARGKSRSDKILNVLENVKEITNAGSKEIILTGVNLGEFGENGENFFQLISALENETTIPRYRISSIEPNLLSDDIIRFVASSKRFMPHFHIPLQSGSDRILGLMRRRYKRKLYADRVNLIKALLPHASIGVDVIVGFPGETEADFQETYSFLESLPITYLHVFTYSERDNTLAATMKDIVSLSIRQTRNKKLRQLSYQKQEEFNNEFSGTTRPVLFEKEEKTSMMEGYTDNYIRIKTPYKKDWVNQIMDWKI
ncbi:MAG: tRNA (N(6)-L-threonylcarbamoyladenosine(37)-C(2))-methylthiotransferase MtaB [Bacteroidota bacterium]|jgi:threonylcarbamoyladenosine tRNA methylthiotransferase MtaB